jgi:hypothetical protein
MNRWWTCAVLGASAGLVFFAGCSGSSDTTTGTTPGPDSGTHAPPPAPNPAPPNPPPPPPPTDGGNDTGLNAPEVTIDYMQTCPAFTPCDTDPTGSWTLTGGCVDSSLFTAAKANCPGLTESNVVIKSKGLSTITATTITQQSETNFTGKLFVPNSCKPSPSVTCTLIGNFLTAPPPNGGGFDSATCADAAGGCDCNVAQKTVTSSSGPYTKSGGVITATSTGDEYDYCVNPANTLTTRQRNQNGTPGPATLTATK